MTTSSLIRAKARAVGLHLAIGLLLFLPFLVLMLGYWYPGPLFWIDGGWQGVRIMAAVDLVLGPLLTALIYHPAKTRRALLVDFSFIGVVQLSALLYGGYSIWLKHPQVLALHEGVLQAVSADALREQAVSPEDWQRLGTDRPRRVEVREPRSAEESAGITAYLFSAGLAPHQLLFLYEPLRADSPALAAARQRVREQRATDAELDQRLAAAPALTDAVELQGAYGRAWVDLDERLEIRGSRWVASAD
ncbi:MAG TPA: hypothetical protein VFV27_08485 [Nevskiaceae bacterium]|nr:hypothetical protein [Nevskiaceae bacterium]